MKQRSTLHESNKIAQKKKHSYASNTQTHTHTRTHIHRIGINVIANIYIESPIGPDQELARCFLNPHTR